MASWADIKRFPLTSGRFLADFASHGLPSDHFTPRGQDVSRHLVAKPVGLHVSHPGKDGYSSSSVETQLRVHGNFAVTVSFESLTFEPGDDGSGGISLMAILENDGHTHCTVHGGATIDPLNSLWHFVQSEFARSRKMETAVSEKLGSGLGRTQI